MVVGMEYEIAAEAHLCEFRAWQCLRHIPPPGPQKLSLFPFWKLGRFHFSLSFFQKRKIERNAQDFFFFWVPASHSHCTLRQSKMKEHED